MPYTLKKDRAKFEPELKELREKILEINEATKGDFTYIFYALALEGIKKMGGDSYTNISVLISCLNDSAEELRRRKLNPYEDKKRKENGDVN